jgi:hypothetical protein
MEISGRSVDFPQRSGDDVTSFWRNKEILAARRDLKMALREQRPKTATERRRIADILKRAADAIRGDDSGA